MSDMSLFFASNAAQPETESVPVSKRFKDAEGKPVRWQIRAISEEENDALRASSTRKAKQKNGVSVPETNMQEYLAKLTAACVVFPNLQDAELQKSYGVRGADAVVRKMLLPGEYTNLLAKIQEINGFDEDINELASEVKN
ncbi:phage tail assembly chaperone [Paenibacillus gansuensis]|uniref:Phage portal protein n=1 Tax=Paenibacillus gansuensis TaxID=306542 RepID=A0ABW5PEG7_9BACL